jgi:hypothetical protein
MPIINPPIATKDAVCHNFINGGKYLCAKMDGNVPMVFYRGLGDASLKKIINEIEEQISISQNPDALAMRYSDYPDIQY